LTKQQFNPQGITSLQCSEAASLPNPAQDLPLIYISFPLAEKLRAYSGSIVSIHNAIYPEDLQNDLAGTSKQDYFVVAVIFKLNEDFEDLSNLVLFPQPSLDALFKQYSTDLPANYKLIVKLNNLSNLTELKNIVANLDSSENEFDFRVEQSKAITDKLDTKEGFLNGTQAIAWLSGFICLLILVGGISQIIENNRKTIALMRISGLQSGVGATFLLLLAIFGTIIPAAIGVILSGIVNQVLASIFKDIVPEFNWLLISDIAGITLLMAAITAIFLTWLHFSHTIPQELRVCQQ
jgi:ABC-type antimicrobial peptide transport system permease subunit